ncbi:lysM and putative peptidoglycan-binding domain-containing protein 2 isoform X2 [Canis lupus dingo]|uniref:lysM and putative peptidoglycan-binding domain-containing protein 2 isoform X2 n=1 Tax=Canis lupus dingo TaxID=286419 RepID=UPI0020C2441F|nr:lysM and putative peptidoglycan-binding domain-containing protein 2 isoform X2 [Canis lupus dingo]
MYAVSLGNWLTSHSFQAAQDQNWHGCAGKRGTPTAGGCARGGAARAGGGARHARPAAPRRGLQPAAPAERPAAAPVRRKRRRRRRRRRTRRRPLGELRDLAASAGPMAASSPAPSPREGGPRAPRAPGPSPPPRPRSGSEAEDAELSLSLARTKTRSYGSTASVRAPLGAGVIERHVEHRVRAGDTLQGIALKYGVTKWDQGSRRLLCRKEECRCSRTWPALTPDGLQFFCQCLRKHLKDLSHILFKVIMNY